MTESNDQLERRRSVNAQQREIYGESWSGRFGRLLAGYGVPQSKLASVIGLSAPMISQLMSGQRVKISNPAVYGRIVRLEELLVSPVSNLSDAGERGRILDEVAASHPSLTTLSIPIEASKNQAPTGQQGSSAPLTERERVLRFLHGLADTSTLTAAAAAAQQLGGGELASLLTEAIEVDREP